MNKTRQLLTLGAALLLAPLTSTFAQSTWETVDQLSFWRGRDIVAYPGGGFFSVAINTSNSPPTVAVNRSSAGGATWETVGLIPGYARNSPAAPDGALFAAGTGSTAEPQRASVWQSLDGGVTWTVSDPWAGQPSWLVVTDITAGYSGAIYLSGYDGHPLVRKGQRLADGGINWSTVADLPAPGSVAAICVAPLIAPGQPDVLLACGSVNGLWTVRGSQDGGDTWAVIDSYQFASKSGYENSPVAVTTGPNGELYVFGSVSKPVGKKGQTEYGWLVRKSANGGVTWSNVDYFVTRSANYAAPSIAADPFGRVFVVGSLAGKWVVRGSADGGLTWLTTDSLLPTGSTASVAWAVACDALGNACVTGEGGANLSYVAPIRRLATP